MQNHKHGFSNVFSGSDVKTIIDEVKRGSDINATDAKGWTYLMIASKKGDVECVKALIKAGANIDYQDRYDGNNALMIASNFNSVECVEAMVKLVSNIDAVNARGETALSISASKFHKNCAKSLVFAGASVNFLAKPSERQEYKKLVSVS